MLGWELSRVQQKNELVIVSFRFSFLIEMANDQ